ncbi:MAG: mandelate racemase/muconate lactonizing enzyme family protein [Rhodothermales bacterium]
MTVEHISVHTIQSPLAVPYTIAYETISEVTNHFVVIRMRDGRVGIGCAAPAPEVTGESVRDSRDALDVFSKAALRHALHELPWPAGRYPSACAAVDMALHDMKARAKGEPLCALSGYRDAVRVPRQTSVTLGIASETETLVRARALFQQGFSFFKVKGGHDVHADVRRLRMLRKMFGNKIRLSLDANQGYGLADVDVLQEGLGDQQVEYVEQPTHKKNLLLLAEAARHTSIPVMADESVQSADDVSRIADAGGVKLINIKLQKMGGLRVAHAIDQRAAESGMGTMLGCMDESALSIAAALHFAATHSNVQYLDLDGHLDLNEDPFANLVSLDKQGRLLASEGIGLGWKTLPFSEA